MEGPAWEIYLTDEVEQWLDGLVEGDPDSHYQVVSAIEALAEGGPNLGRPLVDRVKGSSIHNMKELRPGSSAGSEMGILFAFDPWRSSVLLVAGDKSGNWKQWYREAITRADVLYERYLKERADEEEPAVSTVRWSAIRDKHVDAAGEERVEGEKGRLLGQVRAQRLAELRKRQGMTQRQVAEIMGVTISRVSQIENGELAGIDVLDRYVRALGGDLRIVASFGMSRSRSVDGPANSGKPQRSYLHLARRSWLHTSFVA